MPTPLSEFDLIAQFFTRPARRADLGVGDDCALLSPPPNTQLAISTDMLVEGRHFFPQVDAAALGHKCLAVNLSDLAAMGATPHSFTLAMGIPDANPVWLSHFSNAMLTLADRFDCELIGGDTTKSPLTTISITVIGTLPTGQALRRDAAQDGDDIWVSGTLGDARLALGMFWQDWQLSVSDFDHVRRKMEWPEPRIALGRALLPLAHAAIDISDGLIGDLGHILKRSGLGATLNVDALPLSEELRQQPRERQIHCALYGGDEYELCFTASPEQREAIFALGRQLHLPLSRIGTLHQGNDLLLENAEGESIVTDGMAFDHFRSNK